MYDDKMVELYQHMVRERHQIWLARQNGATYPWTSDPVLANRKFTNMFRVLDPGSQFVFDLEEDNPLDVLAGDLTSSGGDIVADLVQGVEAVGTGDVRLLLRRVHVRDHRRLALAGLGEARGLVTANPGATPEPDCELHSGRPLGDVVAALLARHGLLYPVDAPRLSKTHGLPFSVGVAYP